MMQKDFSVDASQTIIGQIIMDLPSLFFTRQPSSATSILKVGYLRSNIFANVNIFCIADPENVLIVHCNSGKGRTGTAICAVLLFVGYLNNVDDCLKLFNNIRFTCGKGVSQPCQLRYLYYFEAFYRQKIKSPCAKRLRGIQFVRVPNMSSGGCSPFFEVYSCRGLDIRKVYQHELQKWYSTKENGVIFHLNKNS